MAVGLGDGKYEGLGAGYWLYYYSNDIENTFQLLMPLEKLFTQSSVLNSHCSIAKSCWPEYSSIYSLTRGIGLLPEHDIPAQHHYKVPPKHRNDVSKQALLSHQEINRPRDQNPATKGKVKTQPSTSEKQTPIRLTDSPGLPEQKPAHRNKHFLDAVQNRRNTPVIQMTPAQAGRKFRGCWLVGEAEGGRGKFVLDYVGIAARRRECSEEGWDKEDVVEF